ncbi:MAG: DegT/DnrJ/EryC1/StrS family aminotransferase [Nitrospinae bacterium]|nr:DegT/DnrJ/EryC1/StrS family aminotransferase [Nitrospinota bacterium]
MPAKKDFLLFGSPLIEKEEIAEVVAAMESGWLGTGPRVARFEKDFARYKGVDPARVAALNSCSAALHVSMIAARLEPGDEVITTPMTFSATVNSIIHAGAKPVLADIDPRAFNIDPAAIESCITTRTKGLLPVHFGGRPCEMDAITAIAKRRGLTLIEDCAHAIESEYKGRKTGTFGDFGCFSFYVTKNVVTGEGGMVVAKRQEDIERVKVLSLHGMSKDAWHRFGDSGYRHYQVVECGFKYNMMDLQAAIGIHQLARIEKNWLRRREIWDRYQEAFKNLPVERPLDPEPDTRHAFHLYTILVSKKKSGIERDAFLEAITEKGIGVGVHYLSICEHPYYQTAFGWEPEDYPCAMKTGRETVSLPLSAKLSDSDVERVITAVHKIINAHAG